MANKFPTNQSFQRLDSFPLDETMVFDTLAQAQDYASNNPIAYKGQVIHVKDARTSSEINEGVFIYEETCYIDLLKNVVPICSFTYEAMGMFFDLMNEILNNPTEDTRNKIDTLKEIMYDNYAHDFKEVPTGDYHTQPWHPSNYNEYQICLKLNTQCRDNKIGSGYFSATGAGYMTENITINDSYYTVISFNSGQFPTKISFKNGDYIEEIIHICDTSKITNMKQMFNYCKALTKLNVSNFNTSNVEDMSSMFHYCTALTFLDLSNFNTSNAKNMNSMFACCKALTTLDLSNFNTSNVTSMEFMFEDCEALTTLDLSNWDTSNITDMRSMFDGCSSLTFDNIIMNNCSQETIDKITEAYNSSTR